MYKRENLFLASQWFLPQDGEKQFMVGKDVWDEMSTLNATGAGAEMVRDQKLRRGLGIDR